MPQPSNFRNSPSTPFPSTTSLNFGDATLPLHSRTPLAWGRAVLADPIALLVDHAFLEKKAANNAMELMTHWPNDWFPGWVEAMTGVARDEAAHLAQVIRLLIRRGGRLGRRNLDAPFFEPEKQRQETP